jgi:hypothetical protein
VAGDTSPSSTRLYSRGVSAVDEVEPTIADAVAPAARLHRGARYNLVNKRRSPDATGNADRIRRYEAALDRLRVN